METQFRNKLCKKPPFSRLGKLKLSLKHLVQGHTPEKRKSSELKVSHEVPATRKQCHRQGESCPFNPVAKERHFR